MTSTKTVGQAFTWSVMGGEVMQAIQDLRWLIVACIVLIIADFYFGCAESKRKYKEALANDNLALAEITKFHWSRAIRRSCNKFVEYMTLLLVFCIVGLAITVPWGICSYIITAGIGILLPCGCEIVSIVGHFLYLHGIEIEKPNITGKNILVFIGKFFAYFFKKKDEDLGEALEETIENALNDKKEE